VYNIKAATASTTHWNGRQRWNINK